MSENVLLSGAQRKALAALLEGRSIGGAAEAAGVTPRTLARWQGEATFRAELEAGQRAVLSATVRALQSTARRAVEYLSTVVDDETARPADRIRAASVVMAHVLPMLELVDLEERVSRLEAARNEAGGTGKPS